MPRGVRNEYSKEFKLSAVFLMKSKKLKPHEIFNLLNIDRQTVYRWIHEYDSFGESAFNSKSVLPGPEIKRIQKLNKDLSMENEILKKAIAYFANRNTKK